MPSAHGQKNPARANAPLHGFNRASAAEASALADRVIPLDGGDIAAIQQIREARPRRYGDAVLARVEGGVLVHARLVAHRIRCLCADAGSAAQNGLMVDTSFVRGGVAAW